METWADKREQLDQHLDHPTMAADSFSQDELPDGARRRSMFERLKPFGVNHITAYVVGTDAGPDQVGTCTRVQAELAADISVWLIWTYCFAHQAHLIVKHQLLRLGTYFNSLAKLTNVWRAHGNAGKIFRAWKRLFSASRAHEVASKLPPRPLRGRWGSVTLNEAFWLNCGRGQFVEVLKKVFDTAGDDGAAPQKRKTQPLGEDDEREQYTEKLGRWTREAIADIESAKLWTTMTIASVSRRPVSHVANWLQKEATNARGKRMAVLHDTTTWTTVQDVSLWQSA